MIRLYAHSSSIKTLFHYKVFTHSLGMINQFNLHFLINKQINHFLVKRQSIRLTPISSGCPAFWEGGRQKLSRWKLHTYRGII